MVIYDKQELRYLEKNSTLLFLHVMLFFGLSSVCVVWTFSSGGFGLVGRI